MEIFIKIQASCTGDDYKNTVPFQIKGNIPTEQELKEIEEMAKTEAIDSLSFEWSYDIISADEAKNENEEDSE